MIPQFKLIQGQTHYPMWGGINQAIYKTNMPEGKKDQQTQGQNWGGGKETTSPLHMEP